MTENVKECHEKFRKVLSSINPKTVVSDDTFMEKIQSYLTTDSGNFFCYLFTFHNNTQRFLHTEYNEIIKDEETIAWIEKTINSFDSEELPTQQVSNFTLKLLSSICANEWLFASIKEKNLLEKIQQGIEKHPSLQKPSIKLSHIQLLHSISQHSIGLHWLKQTRSWKLSINYYETSNTVTSSLSCSK